MSPGGVTLDGIYGGDLGDYTDIFCELYGQHACGWLPFAVLEGPPLWRASLTDDARRQRDLWVKVVGRIQFFLSAGLPATVGPW